MKIGRAPQPHAPVPVASARVQQAAPAAAPQPLGPPGTRVQGDSMRKAAAEVPELPAGLDLATMLSLARSVAFGGKRFQRGWKISYREGDSSPRYVSAVNPAQVSLDGQKAPSAPDADRDITSGHPLYGRYLDQWLQERPEKGQGWLLVQMLRDRLGEMKNMVRKTL